MVGDESKVGDTMRSHALLAPVALPIAIGVVSPASAGVFDKFSRTVERRGQGRRPFRPERVKDVGRFAGSAAKDVVRLAERASSGY